MQTTLLYNTNAPMPMSGLYVASPFYLSRIQLIHEQQAGIEPTKNVREQDDDVLNGKWSQK